MLKISFLGKRNDINSLLNYLANRDNFYFEKEIQEFEFIINKECLKVLNSLERKNKIKDMFFIEWDIEKLAEQK